MPYSPEDNLKQGGPPPSSPPPPHVIGGLHLKFPTLFCPASVGGACWEKLKTDDMERRTYMQYFGVAHTCNCHPSGLWLHRHLPLLTATVFIVPKLLLPFIL